MRECGVVVRTATNKLLGPHPQQVDQLQRKSHIDATIGCLAKKRVRVKKMVGEVDDGTPAVKKVGAEGSRLERNMRRSFRHSVVRREIVQVFSLIGDVDGRRDASSEAPLAPHGLQTGVLRPDVVRDTHAVFSREVVKSREKGAIAAVRREQLSEVLARDDAQTMTTRELRYAGEERVKNARAALEPHVGRYERP